MTRESNLWTAFKAALPASADAVRIEDCVSVGTPDVNLCLRDDRTHLSTWEGWVELKVATAPKRRTTTFSIAHFTREQRLWLCRRTFAGGNAFLLVQVDRKYLWIRGDVAAVWVGMCTLDALLSKAAWTGAHLKDLVTWMQQ